MKKLGLDNLRIVLIILLFVPLMVLGEEVIFDSAGVRDGKVVLWAVSLSDVTSIESKSGLEFDKINAKEIFERALTGANDPDVRRIINVDPSFSKERPDLEALKGDWEFSEMIVRRVDIKKSWIKRSDPNFVGVLYAEVHFISKEIPGVNCVVYVLQDGTMVPRLTRNLTDDELRYFRELEH